MWSFLWSICVQCAKMESISKYLIKTIETVFISLAIYITNNWISYGEWNECRYMYIEACMWQSPSMTNSKWQGRWPLKSPPLSPNHFKLLILCKNFVCVKSKIIIFFYSNKHLPLVHFLDSETQHHD